MKRLLLLLALIPLWLACGCDAQAQTSNRNTVPPACTAATLLTTCVPQVSGTIARVTDAASSSVCTGGGSTTVICQLSADGSSWTPAEPTAWIGSNGDAIINTPDGTFDFTRDESGTVIITCSDDDANCTLNLDPGGTGVLQLGSTDSLGVVIVTDTDTQIQNGTSGAVTLDLRDYADTTDDDMAHVLFSGNCTTTSTGAEDCDLTISSTEAGSNEARVLLDGDGDIDLTGGDVKLPVEETATFGAPNASFATPANFNQFIGIPRLNVTQLGDAIADGTATAELFVPLAAVCAPITAGSEADDATNFITGAASYQYTAQGTAADNDGFDCTVTGHAVNGTDSIGFWIRSDTALTAGTLDVSLDDGASIEANADLPAITVINEWQWIEVDFASDCDATCADIDGFFIQVTAAGAATSEMDGTVINIDTGAFWLSGAETAIGDVQVGGVISVSVAAVAAGTANTASELVEYTDYIVNYQTGADAVVMITDQSANYGWTLEALND